MNFSFNIIIATTTEIYRIVEKFICGNFFAQLAIISLLLSFASIQYLYVHFSILLSHSLNASNNDVDDTRFTLTLEAARLLTLLLLPLPLSTLELCRAAKKEGKKYCRLKGPRGLDTNARMHGESEKQRNFFTHNFPTGWRFR